MIKHKFVSGKSAAADPTIVDGPAWDDSHVLDGGSTGQVLTRDTAFDPPAGDGWKWAPPTPPDGSVTTPKLADGVLSADAAGRAKMADGYITAPKMRRVEASAKNGSVVTVPALITTITTVDLGSVVAGDRILVFGNMTLLKGATGGRTTIGLEKASGTAAIEVGHDGSGAADVTDQLANSNLTRSLNAMLKVTVSGTLIVRLYGVSLGSDGTVGANAGQLYAWVIPGA